MKKLIIILCSLLLLTGCYNYHELNTLGIVSSIQIKYDDLYHITVEVVTNDNNYYYEGTGNSITESFKDLNTKSDYSLFYNHLNALIIDSNTNIEEVIEYFIRNEKVNNTFYLVISDIEKIYSDNINIGKKIENIIINNNLEYYNFFNISKVYYEDNQDLIIPIYDKKIDTYYIYKDNQIVDKLDSFNSSIYNLLSKKENEIFNMNAYNGNFVISIDTSNINYDINKNDITINVCLEATIKELNIDKNTMNINTITNLENISNNYIKSKIKLLLNTLINNNSDILGINRLILNKYSRLDNTFDSYKYNIKVNTHINKKGLILK